MTKYGTIPALIALLCLVTGVSTGAGTPITADRPPDCWDLDGDGYEDEICGGDDCDDSDPLINPCRSEAVSQCGDGIDQDCTGIETTLGEAILGSPPDGDLDCGGTWEVEPNDDLQRGIVHDLGVLNDGVTTVYGSLETVRFDPDSGYTGDSDYYQFELWGEGFLYSQLMFDCTRTDAFFGERIPE